MSKWHKKFLDNKATSWTAWTAWTRARSQKRCQYINLQAAPLYRIPNHSWNLQKRVLFKIKSFQQFIENSPPTVKHVCLPKYKSNFVWFWVPTWFFFRKWTVSWVAKRPYCTCKIALLPSGYVRLHFKFDFLNSYLCRLFFLGPSLPRNVTTGVIGTGHGYA